MSHKEILKQLCPLELLGDHDNDLNVEGAVLDVLLAEADSLLNEMFPDTPALLIDRWEKRLGLVSAAADSMGLRRDRIVAKWRARGNMSVPFFQNLADQLGYTVTIEENVDDNPNVWRVAITGQPIYQFRAGDSVAGDRLMSWDAATALEGPFEELKPGTSRIIFEYV